MELEGDNKAQRSHTSKTGQSNTEQEQQLSMQTSLNTAFHCIFEELTCLQMDYKLGRHCYCTQAVLFHYYAVFLHPIVTKSNPKCQQ